MASEEEVDEAIEQLSEEVADVCDDTEKWTQEQSAEIFEGVASACRMRAETIRQEMAE